MMMRPPKKEGLTLSGIESDGGVTIMGASGIVVSIIDRGEFLTIETYAYEISSHSVEVEEAPHVRNPRSKVFSLRPVPRDDHLGNNDAG